MSFHFIKQILLFIEVIQEINNRSAKACSSSAIFTLEQCEVWAKLKVKTVELHHRHRSCIFIKPNLEQNNFAFLSTLSMCQFVYQSVEIIISLLQRIVSRDSSKHVYAKIDSQ